MNAIKTISFSVILIFFYSLSFAQPAGFSAVKDKNAVAQKLKKVSIETNTIDSEFIQYKHLDIIENDIVSKGSFSFKSPDKVRWQYTNPYNYLIVMNSGKMWIKDNNKISEYDTKSNKVFKEINDLMIGLLKGNILENPDFNTQFYASDSQILAVLIPKKNEMKDFLTEINIFFDKNEYKVLKIVMNEYSGDYTLIEFKNRKFNTPVSDNNFIIKN